MEFLHSEFCGGSDDVVLVTLDAQANVMLLDDAEFGAYQDGRAFSYFGGWATNSPVWIVPPEAGHWHIVLDLGSCTGTVRASVRIVRLSQRAERLLTDTEGDGAHEQATTQ